MSYARVIINKIIFFRLKNTNKNLSFLPGSHERRTDDVRHYKVSETKLRIRWRARRPVRISADFAEHPSPQRVHDRRRVQPARICGVRRAGRVYRNRSHYVLCGRRMGIFRIVLFCFHIHVDDRIWRFRPKGNACDGRIRRGRVFIFISFHTRIKPEEKITENVRFECSSDF